MDCMGRVLVSSVHPALLIQDGDGDGDGDYSELKFVLISHYPDNPTKYAVFEISNQLNRATTLLEVTHYKVKRSTLYAPFCLPDGKKILQRWICFSAVCSVGSVQWNQKDYHLTLIPLKHYFPLKLYFCHGEKTNNPIKHPDLSCNDTVPDSEHALSSRKTAKHHSVNMFEEELPHGEMPEPKAMKAAAPEHEMAKLLPANPFGIFDG